MKINPDKTGIKHKSQGVLYLGYKIWLNEKLHTRNESRKEDTIELE
jgi:hypothetical protein